MQRTSGGAGSAKNDNGNCGDGGGVLIANGAWMLIEPQGWFAATPIVWRTGIPNDHFIRDVGWTYAAVGALLVWGTADERFRTASLLIAIFWLAGHAVIHLGEAAAVVCSQRQFFAESPQVVGPLLLLIIAHGLGRLPGRLPQ
jgi:hypothetical protein